MRKSLWCVHIPELNEFFAMPSEEAAKQEASAINGYMEKVGRLTSHSEYRAVAAKWPFSLASHMRALEVDWDDLRCMPHRKLTADQQRSCVSSIARWIIGPICNAWSRGWKQ